MHNINIRILTVLSDVVVSAPTYGAGLYGVVRGTLRQSINEAFGGLYPLSRGWHCDEIRFSDGVCRCNIGCVDRDGLFCHFNAVLIEER